MSYVQEGDELLAHHAAGHDSADGHQRRAGHRPRDAGRHAASTSRAKTRSSSIARLVERGRKRPTTRSSVPGTAKPVNRCGGGHHAPAKVACSGARFPPRWRSPSALACSGPSSPSSVSSSARPGSGQHLARQHRHRHPSIRGRRATVSTFSIRGVGAEQTKPLPLKALARALTTRSPRRRRSPRARRVSEREPRGDPAGVEGRA